MIKAIAIDDEPLALRVINTFCNEVSFITLEKTFTRTDEALDYLNNNAIDLIFLDVQMPAMSGIDFYKLIPYKAMVIFSTAYSEYAVEAFNLNVLDYLLKPFHQNRFLLAVNKAKDYKEFVSKPEVIVPHIFIRADYMLHKILTADIMYIEALDDYIKIFIQNSKAIIARMTLKAIIEMLPSEGFIRVHRSYIISCNRINAVKNKNIVIEQNSIPIGASYEKDFFKRYVS